MLLVDDRGVLLAQQAFAADGLVGVGALVEELAPQLFQGGLNAVEGPLLEGDFLQECLLVFDLVSALGPSVVDVLANGDELSGL